MISVGASLGMTDLKLKKLREIWSGLQEEQSRFGDSNQDQPGVQKLPENSTVTKQNSSGCQQAP